jgi:hypothetical protein
VGTNLGSTAPTSLHPLWMIASRRCAARRGHRHQRREIVVHDVGRSLGRERSRASERHVGAKRHPSGSRPAATCCRPSLRSRAGRLARRSTQPPSSMRSLSPSTSIVTSSAFDRAKADARTATFMRHGFTSSAQSSLAKNRTVSDPGSQVILISKRPGVLTEQDHPCVAKLTPATETVSPRTASVLP